MSGERDLVYEGGEESVNQERKIRREIANSNERRRMQSINAGFQSLRTLLPHHEGEKLSKAAILQQTAEYIYSLEQEKTRLLAQNCQLKRLLSLSQHPVAEEDGRRKKTKIEEEVSRQEEPSKSNVSKGTGETVLENKSINLIKVEADRVDPAAASLGDKIKTENCRIILSNNPTDPETIRVDTVANSGGHSGEEIVPGRSYIVTSSSKQNLYSIVEAIKHVEGEEHFSEEVSVPREVVQEEIVGYTLSDSGNQTVSVQKDNSIIILKNCDEI